MYADGPTRVLRFSDDKNMSSLEAQNVILDLAARLKQVRCCVQCAVCCVLYCAMLLGRTASHQAALASEEAALAGGTEGFRPCPFSLPLCVFHSSMCI